MSAYPTQKIVRPFHNGERVLVAEFDPWIVLRERDTGRLVLSFYTLENPRHLILPWPDDYPQTDSITSFADEAINVIVRRHITDNVEWLLAADAKALAPFPGGDRVAVVGKGPTARDWHEGRPLGLDDAPTWEPNLTLYCNHAGANKRPAASNSSEAWIVVIDRNITASEIGPAFDNADGAILSVGVKPELFAEAVTRGLPIHVVCPPQYMEALTPLRRESVSYVVHQSGVGATALGLVYVHRKAGSALCIGLDGMHPIPEKGEEDYDAKYERAALYNDMATANAGVAWYLSSRGVTVRTLSNGYLNTLTPFGCAMDALRGWHNKNAAAKAGVAKMRQGAELAGAIKQLPNMLKDAGLAPASGEAVTT